MTITPAAAAARPAYDGVVPYPGTALAYEGSPLVAVTGDRFQYIEELGAAREKIEGALVKLRQVVDEPVMPTRADSSWRLVTAADDARRAVSPYMNHVPDSPGFANNEGPRFLPDGTLNAEDAVNRRMHLTAIVQMPQQQSIHRPRFPLALSALSLEIVHAPARAQQRARRQQRSGFSVTGLSRIRE